MAKTNDEIYALVSQVLSAINGGVRCNNLPSDYARRTDIPSIPTDYAKKSDLPSDYATASSLGTLQTAVNNTAAAVGTVGAGVVAVGGVVNSIKDAVDGHKNDVKDLEKYIDENVPTQDDVDKAVKPLAKTAEIFGVKDLVTSLVELDIGAKMEAMNEAVASCSAASSSLGTITKNALDGLQTKLTSGIEDLNEASAKLSQEVLGACQSFKEYLSLNIDTMNGLKDKISASYTAWVTQVQTYALTESGLYGALARWSESEDISKILASLEKIQPLESAASRINEDVSRLQLHLATFRSIMNDIDSMTSFLDMLQAKEGELSLRMEQVLSELQKKTTFDRVIDVAKLIPPAAQAACDVVRTADKGVDL